MSEYKKIEIPKRIYMTNGSPAYPVVSLANDAGGEAHWILDDTCYALAIKGGVRSNEVQPFYVTSPWIFTEAYEALKELPPPEEMRRRRNEAELLRVNENSRALFWGLNQTQGGERAAKRLDLVFAVADAAFKQRMMEGAGFVPAVRETWRDKVLTALEVDAEYGALSETTVNQARHQYAQRLASGNVAVRDAVFGVLRGDDVAEARDSEVDESDPFGAHR